MNKKRALAALALTASIALTACDFLNNAMSSDTSGTQTTAQPAATSTSAESEATSDTTADTTTHETTEGDSNAQGGNPDIASYIEVTVSEDKYFYENHEISYDDLIKVFDDLDENTAVRISDENATLKAYESLTNALEERGIPFETAS